MEENKWENENREIQDRYLQKAKFLIENNYFENIDLEDLAIRIYTSTHPNHDNEKD